MANVIRGKVSANHLLEYKPDLNMVLPKGNGVDGYTDKAIVLDRDKNPVEVTLATARTFAMMEEVIDKNGNVIANEITSIAETIKALALLSPIAGADGEDGDSAYEVWINAGNTGTVNDYLNSLIGEKGDDGADGADGKSAYEVWLDEGNTGSEQDFLDSLKGDSFVNNVVSIGTAAPNSDIMTKVIDDDTKLYLISNPEQIDPTYNTNIPELGVNPDYIYESEIGSDISWDETLQAIKNNTQQVKSVELNWSLTGRRDIDVATQQRIIFDVYPGTDASKSYPKSSSGYDPNGGETSGVSFEHYDHFSGSTIIQLGPNDSIALYAGYSALNQSAFNHTFSVTDFSMVAKVLA